MILNILKIQNPTHVSILRATSKDVIEFNRELHDLIQNIVETLFATNGAGLAAPQVGFNFNIFVMRTECGITENTQDHIVIINPHTIKEIGNLCTGQEGCLSIPGLCGDVDRFEEIDCVYYTTEGKQLSGHFTGHQARIFQHENDHLVGTLYIDRATKLYPTKKVSKNLPEYDEHTHRKLLAKSELKHGSYYVGRCRNASIARWNANKQEFLYWRVKFGALFLETIKHPIDDQQFDVFRPIRELKNPKFEIPLNASDNDNFDNITQAQFTEYEKEVWSVIE